MKKAPLRYFSAPINPFILALWTPQTKVLIVHLKHHFELGDFRVGKRFIFDYNAHTQR